MKTKEIVLELVVKDIQASIDFYSEVLDFEVIAQEHDDKGNAYWAKITNDGFSISLKREDRVKAEEEFMRDVSIGGSVSICFEVEDLEEQYEKVKRRCELLHHPHLTPCGATQFSMKDNSGYIINFERFS